MGNGCGASLAVGQACGIQVVFAPTVAGRRTGTLTVTDSAGSSPQIEALTGTGIDFSLSPNGNTSVTVASGGSAVFPLLLASPAGVPGTAVMSCTGAPANATCVVQPASVPLGTTTTVSVTVASAAEAPRLFGGKAIWGRVAGGAVVAAARLGGGGSKAR